MEISSRIDKVNSIIVMGDSRIFSVCALDVVSKPKYEKELVKIVRELKDLKDKIDSEK